MQVFDNLAYDMSGQAEISIGYHLEAGASKPFL